MSNLFGAAPTATPAAPGDFELVAPPGDSISSVSFSPRANFLAGTSWDNQVCFFLRFGI